MAQVEHLGDGAGRVSWRWCWSSVLETMLIEYLENGVQKIRLFEFPGLGDGYISVKLTANGVESIFLMLVLNK